MNEQITTYIKANLAKGVSKEVIETSLLQSGWTKDQIEQAFLRVSSPEVQYPKQPSMQPQTMVVSNSEAEKISQSKKFFWIMGAVFVVIIITGATIFGFIKLRELENDQSIPTSSSFVAKPTSTLTPTLTPSPTPQEPIVDETPKNLVGQDWKVYRNDGYQFEFKYPQDWILEDNLAKFGSLALKQTGNYNGIYKLSGLTINPGQEYESTIFGNPKFINEIQTIQFNGRKALEDPKSLNPSGDYYSRYIRIVDLEGLKNWKPKNVIWYQIIKTYPDLDVFDAVLSTFKFL